MEPVSVGQPAPSFRLPSAQGPEVGLEDYRGKKNVIVWFTKGIGCPFCRQHMTHLARGYDRFRALDTEVLEIAATPPSRGRAYAERFRLAFPYLCDPNYTVATRFGLEKRSHGPMYYVNAFRAGASMEYPPNDFGDFPPPMPEMLRVLRDEDTGFFIVDRQGLVRYALAGSYATPTGVRPIPSNDEIARELEKLQ
jgi:peroxiredoxin